jgi:3-oxoacyl-[acyl-carrier protein] reductase
LIVQQDLTGRTAIVTGAARGLGRAYALRLARAGADVAIVDLELDSFRHFPEEQAEMTAETVVQEIEALGRRALGFEGDLTDPAVIKHAVDDVVDQWGRLDVMVNNAGGGSYGSGADTAPSNVTPDNVRADMERNLMSALNGSQAAAAAMRPQGSGSIINVATQAAILPMEPMYAHYGAAKASVITYSRYLAEELGPAGIRVNVIAPGYIATGRLVPIFEQAGMERITSGISLRRLGTPEDCASVVEFLAGDGAAYVSGQVVSVCGGPHVYGAHRGTAS